MLRKRLTSQLSSPLFKSLNHILKTLNPQLFPKTPCGHFSNARNYSFLALNSQIRSKIAYGHLPNAGISSSFVSKTPGGYARNAGVFGSSLSRMPVGCVGNVRRMSGLGGVGSVRSYSLLALNDLRDNPGARKQKTRKGRGIGSGKGKTAGRGHKGQKARGGSKLGFEGGQTPLRRRLPKRGFKNPFSLTFQPVGLGKIAKLINAGKIDSSELITMKTLKDAGAIGKQIEDGVRLMGRGAEQIKWPIHLEVSRVTVRAKEAVEAAGGSVRRVHYNELGLRALLKPEWFEKKGRLLPKPARPPPKLQDKVDSIGRLPAPTKPIPFFTEDKETATPVPA